MGTIEADSFGFASMSKIKKAPEIIPDALVVEHLENSSPLIFDEIRRWRDLLWDDYIEYKHQLISSKKLVVP